MKNLEQKTFDYLWCQKKKNLIVFLTLFFLASCFILFLLDLSVGTAILINIIICSSIYIYKIYQAICLAERDEYKRRYLEHILKKYEDSIQYHHIKMNNFIERKEKIRSELISLMKPST
jgi:Ca2+/Na+ antiporter